MRNVIIYITAALFCISVSSAGLGQIQQKGARSTCDANKVRMAWEGPRPICLLPKDVRQQEATKRKWIREQRKNLRRDPNPYEPRKEEIWQIITEDWKNYRFVFFHHEDATALRINDFRCVFTTKKYVTDVYECHVGLIGMNGKDPVYANVVIDFVREYYEWTDPFPKLKVFEDQSVDIVIT